MQPLSLPKIFVKEEYNIKAKVGTNVGVAQAASVQPSASASKKNSSKNVAQLQIGLMIVRKWCSPAKVTE